MYQVFDNMCAYMKLFIVWLVIVFNHIYSYDVLYILYQCGLRIFDSEMLYVWCVVDRAS